MDRLFCDSLSRNVAFKCLMFMPEISNRMVFVNGKHPRFPMEFTTKSTTLQQTTKNRSLHMRVFTTEKMQHQEKQGASCHKSPVGKSYYFITKKLAKVLSFFFQTFKAHSEGFITFFGMGVAGTRKRLAFNFTRVRN